MEQEVSAIKIISDNFALILSSLISLAAILATAYQAQVQRKTKIAEMYFSAQLKAYAEFYDLITGLDKRLGLGENRDIRPLFKAGKTAALVSPQNTADAISHFCAVYREYLHNQDAGSLTKEMDDNFSFALSLVEVLLREEIFRHSTQRRHTDRMFDRMFKKRD